MIKIFSLLLSIGVLHLVKGECPSSLDIPTALDNGTFICATYWKGPGDSGASNGLDACNSCEYGDSYTMTHGEDAAGSANSHYPMGSIFVKAGCTLYMYYDNDFGGEVLEMGTGTAAVNEYDNTWGRDGAADCAPGPGSYKCRCVQQPVTCVPEDGYTVVLTCDNTINTVSTFCSFFRSIGTAYEASMAESMNIDVTIAEEMTIQLFRLFSNTLGISVETGYNWEHTTSEVQSTVQSVEVDAEAPAGTMLTIEQTVGFCGGSVVNTDMFRTSTYSRDGTLLSRKIERLPIGGEAILIEQLETMK